LIHHGKVRAIGSSTFPAEQIVEAQWAAARRNLERFRCEQPPYSIFVRTAERSVLPTCERYGMGVMVWSPLAGGWLTGRYRRPDDVDLSAVRPPFYVTSFDPNVPGNPGKFALIDELSKIASEAGCSLTHLAIAFILAHRAVTAAIIGPNTHEQLVDLLAGADLRLEPGLLDRIDDLVPPGTDVGGTPWYRYPATEDATLRRRQ
jgi:aryl-alcohol dehydrogenase-like predicted oxidoreductase